MRIQKRSSFRLNCQKMLFSTMTGFIYIYMMDTAVSLIAHITFSVWLARYFRDNSWIKCTQHFGVLASLGYYFHPEIKFSHFSNIVLYAFFHKSFLKHGRVEIKPNPGSVRIRSSPSLQHCRWILYQLSHKGSPRTLEWVVYPFSRGSFQPRNQTRVSCIAGGFLTNWAIRETQEIKQLQ